jgi:hypothetical protein
MKRAALLPRSRKDNVVIRELDDETLVYDVDRDEAHCLNRTAALVWAQCDGKTTAAQATRALQTELDSAVDTDLVWLAVKQLQRFHLVEASAKAPRVSRRDLVLKYAPAALVLLPVIVSITAPTPAQAATCGMPCQSTATPCPPGCRCSFSSNTCVPFAA